MNKSLYEAKDYGRSIHVFELINSNEYLYHGLAEVIDRPGITKQPDVNMMMRDVLVFKLRMIEGKTQLLLREKDYKEIQEKKEKNIVKLPDDEIERLAKMLQDNKVQ